MRVDRYPGCTGEAEEGDTGPGQMFAPFLAMEDLLDKLKLLNYEKELVLKMRMRPINRQSHWLLSPTPHIILSHSDIIS